MLHAIVRRYREWDSHRETLTRSATGGKKYIGLATFRRIGQEVRAPAWFAEQVGELCVITRSRSHPKR